MGSDRRATKSDLKEGGLRNGKASAALKVRFTLTHGLKPTLQLK